MFFLFFLRFVGVQKGWRFDQVNGQKLRVKDTHSTHMRVISGYEGR